MRGVLSTPEAQLVFVDTPGLHKPVTALGERVNATALDSVSDVDAVCLVIDATKPFGTGDQWVAGHLDLPTSIVIVNKIDAVNKDRVIGQLSAASSLGAADYFPVSAKTGEGIPALIAHLTALMPEGPLYFPDDTVSDQPEETVGRRARARATARRHPRRAAVQHRHTGDRVGVAADPRARSSSSATARRAWSSARAVRC